MILLFCLARINVCNALPAWPWVFLAFFFFFLRPTWMGGNTEECKRRCGEDTRRSRTLYLSLICHWLFLLHLTGKAKHGLWFCAPSAGALADPPAVILDFMSAVPESQPQLIQGHPFLLFYFWRIEADLFSGTVPCASETAALVLFCSNFASVCSLLSKCQSLFVLIKPNIFVLISPVHIYYPAAFKLDFPHVWNPPPKNCIKVLNRHTR